MLTYSGTDVDRLNAVADLLLLLVGYCIGDNDLLESAAVQGFDSGSTQDAVGDNRNSVLCAALVDQDTCGFDKSTACVSHVVNENSSLASYLSNECHSRDLVGTSALFVNKRKRQVETVSDGCRSVPSLAQHIQK